MYEAFYGLDERPFNLTPDPRYLYLSEKHKEAFAHLVYGINNRSGFVMVSGEIGTGKTTLCRSLLEQLDDDTKVAFIFNPFLSPLELLGKINEEFGVPSSAETAKGLIDELNAYLLDRAAQGINCVLVIDEAQNLEPRVLEQIRLLSNLETSTQKLLQIILIGQPELAQHLALPELRQLNQRITARYHLKALNRQETMQYIAFRLRAAGGRRKVTFTRSALKLIHRYSGGTPRVINALCDRALLIGYTQDVHDITKGIVRKAHREIRGERVQGPKPVKQRRFRWAPLAAALAVVALLGGVVYYSAHHMPPWLETSARYGFRSLAFDTASWVGAGETPIAEEAPAEAPESDILAPLDAEEPEEDAASESVLATSEFNALDPEVARNAAAVALLRRWDASFNSEYPEDGTAESLAAFAEDNGLNHEILSPNLEQLININLPSFVRLASDRHTVWAGLLEIRDGEAVLAKGIGETFTMPLAEFRDRYTNQAVIVWRDPTPDAVVLVENSQGGQVEALQVQLRGLGWLNHEITRVYDAATRDAVIALQEDTGLTVDGLTGPQTRMVLTSWAGEAQTPALVDLDDGEGWKALAAAAPDAEFRLQTAARASEFEDNTEVLAQAGSDESPEPQDPDANEEPAGVDAPQEIDESSDEPASLPEAPAEDDAVQEEIEADEPEMGEEPLETPSPEAPQEPVDENLNGEDTGESETRHPFMMHAREPAGIGAPAGGLIERLRRGADLQGLLQPAVGEDEEAETGASEYIPEPDVSDEAAAEDSTETPPGVLVEETPDAPPPPEVPEMAPPESPALPDWPVAAEPVVPEVEELEPPRAPSSLWPTGTEISVPEPQRPEPPSIQSPDQPSMPSWPERPAPPTGDPSGQPWTNIGSPTSLRMEDLPPPQRLEFPSDEGGGVIDGEDEEGS